MATSYSANLALALPATGELSGTWGTTVNSSITNMLDEALGYQAYSATGGADTITIPDGTTGVARSIYIQLNGTGGGSVAVPTTKTKMYFVFNNTASAITFKVTGQTGVSIPAAAKMALVSNGTDIIVAQNYFASLSLSSLTSGRVTYAGASGLLQDSANLTFSGTALAVGGTLSATGKISTTQGGAVTDSIGITPTTGTDRGIIRFTNTGGDTIFGAEASSAGQTIVGSTAYDGIVRSHTGVSIGSASALWSRFSSTGLAVTGTLSTTGDVGIGTSSPSSRIDARLAASGSGAVVTVGNVNNGQFGGFGITDGGVYPLEVWGNVLAFKTNGASYAGTTEKMRLDTSGYLGIGETVPVSRIHVSGTGFGATTTIRIDSTSTSNSAPPSLILTRSSSAVMSAQGIGNIYFTRLLTDASLNTAASIVATGDNSSSAPTCTLNYDALTTQVWKINSTQVASISSTGLAVTGTLSATGNATLSGATAEIQFTGATYGWLRSTVGDLYIDAPSAKSIFLRNAGTTIGTVSSTGLAVTGTLSATTLLDISAATAGQIKFPATQNASSDANTLDDYEEGTFTPALTNFTIGNGSAQGRYTKIGQVVTIEVYVLWGSTTSASGAWSVNNLPFTSGATQRSFGSCNILDSGTENYWGGVQVTESSTTLSFLALGASATYTTQTSVTASVPMTWTTNDAVRASVTYTV